MTTDQSPTPANPYAAPQSHAREQDQDLLTTQIDPDTAIVAEGVVTAEEFFEAQKLHRASRRTTDILWGVLLLLFASGGIKLLADSGRAVVIVVVLIVIVHLLLWRLVLPRIAARRVWQRSRSLHQLTRRLITPELVQTITADSNVIVRWSAYVKYRSSETVMLFYLAEHPQLFTMFARSMFESEEDWEQFQQLVREQLPEA